MKRYDRQPAAQSTRRDYGFTLLEMLIVIAIVAVLVAIAIPVFTAQLDNARKATCSANERSLQGAYAAAYMTNPGADPSELLKQAVEAMGSNATITAKGTVVGLCPSDGTYAIDYDDNGLISIICDQHPPAGYASLTADELDALFTQLGLIKTDNKKYYSKDNDGGLYNALTAAEQAFLDQFSNWTVKYDTRNKGYRVFATVQGQSGIYKYNAATGQYQYSWTGSIASNGSVTGDGSNYTAWYDTMEEAYAAHNG